MQLPRVKYSELDQSSVPQSRLDTIHGLIVQTMFGLDDKPYLVSSLDQFKRLFGGYNATTAPYFPQIKRALSRGVQFYIQRLIGTGAVAATYVIAGKDVTITAKSKGSWGNSLSFTMSGTGFNLTYSADPSLNEAFSAADLATLAAKVNDNSNLVIVTLGASPLAPAVVTPTALATGADGSFADTAAKDVAVNALYPKFNDYTDLDTISQLCTFSKAGVDNLVAYAESRQDLIGVFEVDPSSSIANATTFMTNTSTGIGSTKSSFVAGYFGTLLKAWSPEAGDDVDGPVLLDVLSVWSKSDTLSRNRLKAPAGPNRGTIDQVKTFTNNLLSSARRSEADALVATGLNLVGSHANYGPVVWGAKTLNRNNSALDNIHVRRMLLDLKRNLAPVYERILFEINEPTAWRSAYLKAKVLLDELVKAKVIAPAYGYLGDQDASVMSGAVFNKVEDLANGIYKTKITLVPYGYIEDIGFQVVVNSINSTITTA